ncbi:MAG TPA: hypothetical protein VI485_08280 [Vicinamibacterales bacterium]|nr:hypothetical protein [Vicinamibacterales bacterium]
MTKERSTEHEPTRGFWISTAAIAAGMTLAAQQMPDRSFRPMIEDRAFAVGAGPLVCFVEAHDNLHTLDDAFWPFGELVRRDGYLLRAVAATFDGQSLADCRILVIADSQPGGLGADTVPAPPTFGQDEVAAIHRWVVGGGRLLLIGNHLPQAASSLAAAFGVTFVDRLAVDISMFRSADRTLPPHAIVRGRHAKESVATVSTYKGRAFQAPATAEALLVDPDGLLQGAAMRVESGRAAFFGDAALFTAQIVGRERRLVGMNALGRTQNFQFVLNVMHWLSGVL